MTTAEGFRNVLRAHGVPLSEPPPEAAGGPVGFVLEGHDDGSAVVRHGHAAGGGFSDRALQRCADLAAEAGFLVALLRDQRGVYLRVS